jgi:hypothetical protein
MSTAEYNRKLDELDRLLNDPDVPMQPDRIWSLLADVSRPEASAAVQSPLASSSESVAALVKPSAASISRYRGAAR